MIRKGQLLESPKKAFGERLRLAREAVGLTQFQLGEKLGVEPRHAQATVSKWESGTWPTPERWGDLAAAVRATVDWLVTGAGSPPKGVAPIERARLTEREEGDESTARRKRRRG